MTSKPFDPLAMIPTSGAIRAELDAAEQRAEALRILLRTAEEIERTQTTPGESRNRAARTPVHAPSPARKFRMVTSTQAPATPATGLLSIEAAALELQATPQAVQRLIAKRMLPASRLGPDGAYRIDVDALADYIRRNCPDLLFPELDRSLWFSDEPSGGEAGAIVHAMIEAELADGGQQLTDEQVAKWKADNRRETVLAVDLRLTAAGRAIWNARPAAPFVKARGVEPARPLFRTAGEMALGYLFYRKLRLVLDGGPRLARSGGRLAKLYATPEGYAQHVTQTAAELLASRLPFEERQSLTVGPSKSQVVVKYGFQFATLTTLAELTKLAGKLL